MDQILQNIKYNKIYTNDIINTKYTQVINETNISKYKSLEEFIIYTYDVNSILEKTNKLYVNKKKIEIADKYAETHENIYKYSKRFKKALILNGLQKSNTFSTILFLSDLYNISIVLYNNNKYYELFYKCKNKIYVMCDKTGWYLTNKNNDINIKGELNDLSNLISKLDVESIYV